jgi:hypothetical protein
MLEQVEDRRMLMFAALPDQALPIGTIPVAVAIGHVDQDAWPDLVSLGSEGRLTVVINGGDGGWSRLAVSDLGLDATVTLTGQLNQTTWLFGSQSVALVRTEPVTTLYWCRPGEPNYASSAPAFCL